MLLWLISLDGGIPSLKGTRSNQIRIGPENEKSVPVPIKPTTRASIAYHSGNEELYSAYNHKHATTAKCRVTPPQNGCNYCCAVP
jgi:hypothetical protein